MKPGEGTKERDIYRAGNQGRDGVQVSDDANVRLTMVTGIKWGQKNGSSFTGAQPIVLSCRVFSRYL
jgi:hypothetical protein